MTRRISAGALTAGPQPKLAQLRRPARADHGGGQRDNQDGPRQLSATAGQVLRDARGRFLKDHVANPAGRPVGSIGCRTSLRQYFKESGPAWWALNRVGPPAAPLTRQPQANELTMVICPLWAFDRRAPI